MLITYMYDPQHPLRGVNRSISHEFLLHGYKECQQLCFFCRRILHLSVGTILNVHTTVPALFELAVFSDTICM